MSTQNDDKRRDGKKFSAEKIIDEASRPDVDAVQRQILRGDETQGDADDRDVAGAVDYDETPHGGEERKTQIKKEAHHDD